MIASNSAGETQPFSVIVPVHNEARGLAERARALLTGLPPGCELVFVCNGCTDDSEAILRATAGDRALVLLTDRGKARAIRHGEAHVSLLPRFYVDSDVRISGGDLAHLAACLESGVELVSPRIVFDLAGASWGARQLNTFWQSLPHGRGAAFHHVLGVSASGRARWAELPDIIADDLFIEAQMAWHEKRIVEEVAVITRPPRRVWQWIRVRARWQQGIRQLRRLGVPLPPSGQLCAIGVAALSPAGMVPAGLYVVANVAARIMAWSSSPDTAQWYSDPTSR